MPNVTKPGAIDESSDVVHDDTTGGTDGNPHTLSAELDDTGVLRAGQLPDLAVTNTSTVTAQSDLTSLAAEQGDVAIVTDDSQAYILTTDDPTALGNWVVIKSPPAPVDDVFGRTGSVSPQSGDYSASEIANFAPEAEAAAPIQSVNGSTGDVSVAGADPIGLNESEFQSFVDDAGKIGAAVSEPVTMGAIVPSPAAMDAVSTSSTAMDAVSTSSTAMDAVSASSTAMDAVSTSSTAMDAVSTSSTAMDAVSASSTAMDAVSASSTAMDAVSTSSTAMDAVSASIPARTAVLKSTYAVENIWSAQMPSTSIWDAGDVTGGNGTHLWNQDFDLSGVSTMSIQAIDTTGGGDIEIRVNGTTILSTDGSSSWTSRSLDVSSYSGTQTVSLGLTTSGFGTIQELVDGPSGSGKALSFYLENYPTEYIRIGNLTFE